MSEPTGNPEIYDYATIIQDPLNRPEKDLRRELKRLKISMDDYKIALKTRWGDDWESHFPKEALNA